MDGLEVALKNLKDGKVSVVKYVFGIEETEGGQKESRILEDIKITSLYHSCIPFSSLSSSCVDFCRSYVPPTNKYNLIS